MFNLKIAIALTLSLSLSLPLLLLARVADAAAAATPVISNITSDIVANIGDDVEFNCTVANVGRLSVNWVKRANTGSVVLSLRNLLGLNDPRYAVVETIDQVADTATYSISIADIEPSDMGIYECQVTLSPTEKITSRLALILNTPAIVSPTLTNASVVAPENQTLAATCVADGFPSPTISWIRENNALLPFGGYEHHNVTLRIEHVSRYDRGNYYCVAENGIGPADRRLVRFDVEFAPVLRVSRPKVGQAIDYPTKLVCIVEGYPAPVISWKRKGAAVQSSGNYEISNTASSHDTITSELRIGSVTESDYGDYYCKAVNKHGSATARLNLFATPYAVEY